MAMQSVKVWALASLLVGLMVDTAFAETYVYVDGRNGNDTWDGSCAYADRDEAAKKGPLKTFSKFKDKYNKVDDVTVYIAPDTYYSATPFSYWGRPG